MSIYDSNNHLEDLGWTETSWQYRRGDLVASTIMTEHEALMKDLLGVNVCLISTARLYMEPSVYHAGTSQYVQRPPSMASR